MFVLENKVFDPGLDTDRLINGLKLFCSFNLNVHFLLCMVNARKLKMSFKMKFEMFVGP